MRRWKANVIRIGSSKGVVIPKLYCDEMGINVGDTLKMEVEVNGDNQ